MNRSTWPLRLAAVGAFLLCILCAYLAGAIKGLQVAFLIGQILFGAAAFVIVVIVMVMMAKKIAD
jgi:hypothetical protein